jgi:hypothetical protein
VLGSSCLRSDPWARLPGRVVTNVLIVATFQLGDPMLFLVVMVPDDASRNAAMFVHEGTPC